MEIPGSFRQPDLWLRRLPNRWSVESLRPFNHRDGLPAPPWTQHRVVDRTVRLGRGRKTQGSAIRRIGHERWLRNLAVALGNAPDNPAALAALRTRECHPSELVREHVQWAIQQHAMP